MGRVSGRAGIESVHWSKVGAGDALDDVLMQWSASNGYVVLTSDLDFGAILTATQRRNPSVVQVRSDNLSPDVIGPAVVAALGQMAEEVASGAILSIDAARARIRVLPLPR